MRWIIGWVNQFGLDLGLNTASFTVVSGIVGVYGCINRIVKLYKLLKLWNISYYRSLGWDVSRRNGENMVRKNYYKRWIVLGCIGNTEKYKDEILERVCEEMRYPGKPKNGLK